MAADVVVVTQGPNLVVTQTPTPTLIVQAGAPGPAGAATTEIGGIAILAVKTYTGRLPFPDGATIQQVTFAGVAGVGASTFCLVVDGVQAGPTHTIPTATALLSFTSGVVVPAGSVIQVQVLTVGGTPPANVTFQVRWA